MLAERYYLRELWDGNGAQDGEPLVDVLERMAGEVEAVMLGRGTDVRNLAMVLTKLTEARHWALEEAIKRGGHAVVDGPTLRELIEIREEIRRETEHEEAENGHVPASG